MHPFESIRREVLRMAEAFRPIGMPHQMLPYLEAGDVIGFEMPMAEVNVRVLNPTYATLAPLRWGIFKGYVKYNGALDELSRGFVPLALIPGYGARFAHPGDNGTYIDIGPTTRITVNGQPIE